MQKLGIFSPSNILSHASPQASPRRYQGTDGRFWDINMKSHRYWTFQQSLSCVCCGITGEVMILERDWPGTNHAHFNLYAFSRRKLMLMTKDHIVPKAKGGQDTFDNYQTMCERCNSIKSDCEITLNTLRVRRQLHDLFNSRKYPNKTRRARRDKCIFYLDRAKFWSHVEKTSECWNWTGKLGRKGYPRYGHKMVAYLIAYELATDTTPPRGLRQTCKNKLCCNPAHMEV